MPLRLVITRSGAYARLLRWQAAALRCCHYADKAYAALRCAAASALHTMFFELLSMLLDGCRSHAADAC